jgi:hypothetical protein
MVSLLTNFRQSAVSCWNFGAEVPDWLERDAPFVTSGISFLHTI